MATRKRLLVTCTVVAVGLILGGTIAIAVSLSSVHYWIASLTAPRAIQAYVRSHPVRMLQIGSGQADLPGWLNTDIEPAAGETYLDATLHFPMPDGSFHYIFGEHVIEHLSYDEGLIMLRECYRVLAPGGKIRLSTPNLMKFFRLFQDPNSEESRNYVNAKLKFQGWPPTSAPEAVILNLELSSFGHQFVYDPATLSDRLSQVGFHGVAEFVPGESDDPKFRGIETRHNHPAAREMNNYESMVLQAVRP